MHPGDADVELLTPLDGRLMKWCTRGRGPQIQLVAGRAAFEAPVGILGKIYGKRATFDRRRAVDWACASDLAARTLGRNEPEQFQHLRDRDLGALGPEINRGHACRGDACRRRARSHEQRRGTRSRLTSSRSGASFQCVWRS